jgi:hypothetical protein
VLRILPEKLRISSYAIAERTDFRYRRFAPSRFSADENRRSRIARKPSRHDVNLRLAAKFLRARGAANNVFRPMMPEF